MTSDRAGTLEEKVAAAKEVVEHLLANCHGFESDEWLAQFIAIRDALDAGRLRNAIRTEARFNGVRTKWVGSAEMVRCLERVMGVLSRHVAYPNHVEPVAQLGDLPSQIFVDCMRQTPTERSEEEFVAVAFLKVTTGLSAGQLVALPFGRTVIGRSPVCQIVVEDAGVNRQHADILADGGRSWIQDLCTRNGTYVNGTRIDSLTKLKDCDFIRVCDHAFQFLLLAPHSTEWQWRSTLQKVPDA